MLQSQESAISPMRYYDVCAMFDHSLVLILQLILNRKKLEMKKFCVLQFGFFSSFSFRGHITSSFVILTIIEIITNSCWRKSLNEWLPEKKALDVLRSLGSPGKRIPELWHIELQICQSDNVNGLWLVCWNVQLSFTCSWTISPCCKDSFLTERLRLYVYTPCFTFETRQQANVWSVFS